MSQIRPRRSNEAFATFVRLTYIASAHSGQPLKFSVFPRKEARVRLGIALSNPIVLGVIAFAGACTSDSTGPQPTKPTFAHEPGHNFAYCLTNVVTGAAVSRTSVYTCTTTNTFSPYYYHSSSEGKMAPITFTFSRPVKDLDILAEFGPFDCTDPSTFPTYVAYGPTGLVVASGRFEEKICPIDSQADVDLYTVGEIKTVVITAPTTVGPNGYRSTYRMEFNETCLPTNDQILDDPGVKGQLLQALAASRPNPDGTDRRERGGYVYVDDETGVPFLVEELQEGFTECSSNLKPPVDVPVIAGFHFIGYWHTHPNNVDEPHYSPSCRDVEANRLQHAKTGPREDTGGGSSGDWGWANLWQRSVYIIDLDKRAWRLDPGRVTESQWAGNPNRWKFDSRLSCLVRF
jgi:hypothetical protein